jgi:hypothetical protein
MDAQLYQTEGNKPNCSGHRIQVINGEDVNSIQSEARTSLQLQEINTECLREKINELETNSRKKNVTNLYRGE